MAQERRIIAGYEILDQIGAGGNGTVHRARQLSLGREIALKLVAPRQHADRHAAARFLREARLAAAINHPHVVSIIDVGEVGDELYLAMELIDGGDLQRLTQRSGGRLDEARALAIIGDACSGLAALHQAGLLHRDIKPANILLTRDGRAKLADLGLARPVAIDGDQLTSAGLTVGTPAYLSPEQAEGMGEIDIRSDIYALGATLYAITTGATPYKGGSAFVVIARILTEPPPDPRAENPGLSDGLVALLARAMAKDRRERFATPDEMLRAIRALQRRAGGDGVLPEHVVGQGPVAAATQRTLATPRRSNDGGAGYAPTVMVGTTRRRTARISVFVAVAITLIAGAAWWRVAGSPQRSTTTPVGLAAPTTTGTPSTPAPVASAAPAAPTTTAGSPAPRQRQPHYLIGPGAEWRTLAGSVEAPTTWREVGFPVAAWPKANSPLMVESHIRIRRDFNFNDPAKAMRLVLRARGAVDLVAWVNGVEAGALQTDATAQAQGPDAPWSEVTLAKIPLQRVGNVLALELRPRGGSASVNVDVELEAAY